MRNESGPASLATRDAGPENTAATISPLVLAVDSTGGDVR